MVLVCPFPEMYDFVLWISDYVLYFSTVSIIARLSYLEVKDDVILHICLSVSTFFNLEKLFMNQRTCLTVILLILIFPHASL